jgi:peptidoglycan/LPS O-acetylase OafA/YrhL
MALKSPACHKKIVLVRELGFSCCRTQTTMTEHSADKEKWEMTIGTILLIILILVLIGAIPSWPHSSGWGYGPAGLIGTILIVVLILVLLGRL